MACCSERCLKTLSYISAVFQLILFGAALAGTILEWGEETDMEKYELYALLVFAVVTIPLLIWVLVDLHRGTILGMTLYIHEMHVVLAITLIHLLYEVVVSTMEKMPFWHILARVTNELVLIGVETLFEVPIHLLHKKWHHRQQQSHDEENKTKDDGLTNIELKSQDVAA